jgi:hypothetical protein
VCAVAGQYRPALFSVGSENLVSALGCTGSSKPVQHPLFSLLGLESANAPGAGVGQTFIVDVYWVLTSENTAQAEGVSLDGRTRCAMGHLSLSAMTLFSQSSISYATMSCPSKGNSERHETELK